MLMIHVNTPLHISRAIFLLRNHTNARNLRL